MDQSSQFHLRTSTGTVHSRVVQLSSSNVSQSITIFGTKGQDGSTPLVLVPKKRGILNWRLSVPSGVFAVVQRFGKDLGLFEAGLHLLPPWYRLAYVVTKQSCVYDAPVKNCPTSDNVLCACDLTLIFAVQDPRKFVYGLGASRFDELLTAAAEEAARALVRSTPVIQVYSLRGSRATHFLEILNDKFNEFGVLFTDAKITQVALPPDVEKALEEATIYDRKLTEQIKSQEYALQKLNNEGDASLMEMQRRHDRMMKELLARKERILIERERTIIKAQEDRDNAIINAKGKASVGVYKAEAELKNAEIRGQANAREAILKAEAVARRARINADERARVMIIESEAELSAAQNRAKALEVKADAEAVASKQLRARRLNELRYRQCETAGRLIRSTNMVFAGDQGDKFLQRVISGELLSEADLPSLRKK